MPFDPIIIQRKISLINKDLKEVFRFGNLSLKDYLANFEYEVLAERYLERIIGRMIDINFHILTKKDGENPSGYYQSFMAMGKKGYIDLDLAENLAKSSGLRNRLAHEYDEIDEKKIYEALQGCKRDIPVYLECILKLIKEKEGNKLF